MGDLKLGGHPGLRDRAPPARPLKTVHIWWANLNVRLEQSRKFLGFLDAEERIRMRRFHAARQQRRFLACRGLLRSLLATYLADSPAAIRFTHGSHGKPRLAGTAPDEGLVFNVSHSRDRALIAIGYDVSLGVDVEAWRALDNLEGMVRRCLAPVERERWRALPEPRRQTVFFELWTQKESFVKAVGRGLGLRLDQCVVAGDSRPRFLGIPEGYGDTAEWLLMKLDAGPGFSAALSVKDRDCRVIVRDVRDLPPAPEGR